MHRLAEESGDWGDLVCLLGSSGLRWGEVVALRVGSIHFLRKRIEVVESTVEVGGHLVEGLPKNSQRRSVSIAPEVLEVLSVRCAGKSPADRVFTGRGGSQLLSQNFGRRVWAPAVEAAGLGPLRIHELRHTSVSLAKVRGIALDASFDLFGDRDLVRDLGFRVAAAECVDGCRHAV